MAGGRCALRFFPAAYRTSWTISMKPLSTANLGTVAMITAASGRQTPREPELVIRKTRLPSRSRGSISRRRIHPDTAVQQPNVFLSEATPPCQWGQASRKYQPTGRDARVIL